MYLSEIQNRITYNQNYANSPNRYKPNQKIGRLTVIRYIGSEIDKTGKPIHYYECTCECGNPHKLAFSEKSLRRCITGDRGSISCGCVRKEQAANLGKTINKSFNNIYSPEDPAMKLYHYIRSQICIKNNIPFAEEWKGPNGANNFCIWCYSNGFKEEDGLNMFRRDLNRGYSPDNCYFHYNESIVLIKRPFEFTHSGSDLFLNKGLRKG